MVGAGNSGAEIALEVARTHDVWLSGPDTGRIPVRVKPNDLADVGVERVPRVTGVEHGRPRLDDGRRMEVANVVWCTGFHPGCSWIDLPVLEESMTEPAHHRGVVEKMPGLYLVGLKFLHSVSSEQIHGVGRDAAHVTDAIVTRREESHRGPQVGNPQESLESV